MSEEAITQEQMGAFVEKLNGFMATISEQEGREGQFWRGPA